MTSKKERDLYEEVGRARKALERNRPVTVACETSAKLRVGNAPRQVGEYASVCLVGPLGPTQYTICRPIGLTDLPQNAWTIIPTDEVSATIARSVDPRKSEVDKERSLMGNELLERAGLLASKEVRGRTVLFYPHNEVDSRSSLIKAAEAKKRAQVAPLRAELDQLPKSGAGRERSELNIRIQAVSNLLDYLEDEETRQAEVAIKDYLRRPDIVEAMAQRHPYRHRTLVGPYGDQPQVAIAGATGFPLIDVLAAIRRQFASGLDLSRHLPDMPSVRVRGPEGSLSFVVQDSGAGAASSRAAKGKKKS